MPPQIQIADEPKKSHTMLIVLVLIMIVIGILAIIIFLNENKIFPSSENQNLTVASNVSTTTDQFAGWKTYKNDAYGIEFKYPSDWNSIFVDDINADYPGGDATFDPTYGDDDLEVYLKTSDSNYQGNLSGNNTWSYTSYSGYAPMFDIYISSPFSWEANLDNPSKQTINSENPVILTKKYGIIYGYKKNKNIANDLTVPYSEIDKILSTFKLSATSTNK